MKKLMLVAILGLAIGVCLPVSPATADQWDITVPDASFEIPALSEGDYIDIADPTYEGPWRCVSGDAWIDYGYWRVGGYAEDLYAHSGNNKVYPYLDYVYQILDEEYIEGGTYTLSVWVGQPWEGYNSDWRLCLTTEDYTEELAETDGWAAFDWEQVSLTYTATANDVGEKIGIKIWSNEEVSFDDVTLSYDGPPGNRRATKPIPPDRSHPMPSGTSGDGYYMLLTFTPGYGAVTHTGYFSDNFEDVNDRDPAHSLGSPPWPSTEPETFYVGYDDPAIPAFARTPLERGKTYYWAVDEFDGSTTWAGKVWSFAIMAESAWGPTPADRAEYVDGNSVALSWKLGDIDPNDYTITYDVYWGTDQNAVAAGTSDTVNVSSTTHTIGPLSGSTVYYWKVDTVLKDKVEPFETTIIGGMVWRFTTLPTPAITDPDLVGWWKLDGEFPGYVFDYSGYANHGARQGDPVWVAGYDGGALKFDGVGDYVEIDYSPIFALNDFTVSAWVNIGTEPGTFGVFGTRAGEDNTFDFKVMAENIHGDIGDGSTWIDTAIDIDPGDTGASGQGGDLAVGTWYLITYVIDNTNQQVRLYLDGDLKKTVAISGVPLLMKPGQTMRIGHTGTGSEWMNGLIDDVRVYKKALSTKEVKILMGLVGASSPRPFDHATDAPQTPTLRWEPGVFTASTNGHILYFSDDRDAVLNRSIGGITLTNPQYTVPASLDLGKTYYWAVDEVNGPNTWPGDLWTFTVRNYLIVDDMESYDKDTNFIFLTWKDGIGNVDCEGGNGTGATLSLSISGLSGSPQAMQFTYDNDGMVTNPCTGSEESRAHYSKIEVLASDLPSGIGSDWTVEGVKALSLRFYGDPNNAIEPMWVKLTDASDKSAKVTYGDYDDEDPADVNEQARHEWIISLADFTGVDLSSIKSIAIGIGTEGSPTPGGSGTVYFDDIRLYVPACVLSRRSPQFAVLDYVPQGDPAGDCVVNRKELEVMAENWLGVVPGQIAIADASFEIPLLAEGDYIDIADAAYTGPWKCVSGDAWIDYGYWRATGWPEDLYAHSGNNKAYANGDHIYQVFDETYIEGQTYILNVWVGQPWEGYASGWRLYFTTEDPAVELAETEGWAGFVWEQVSLEYTATATDAGKKIGIKMWSHTEVSFDDVTLYRSPGSLVADSRVDLNGDNKINFKDFVLLADRFLDEELFPRTLD